MCPDGMVIMKADRVDRNGFCHTMAATTVSCWCMLAVVHVNHVQRCFVTVRSQLTPARHTCLFSLVQCGPNVDTSYVYGRCD